MAILDDKRIIWLVLAVIVGGGIGFVYLEFRSESTSSDAVRIASEKFNDPSTSGRSDGFGKETEVLREPVVKEDHSDVKDVVGSMESILATVTGDMVSVSFGDGNEVKLNGIIIEDYGPDRLSQLLHRNELKATTSLANARSAPQFFQFMQKLGSEGVANFSLNCSFETMSKDGANYLMLQASDGSSYQIDSEWNCVEISKN